MKENISSRLQIWGGVECTVNRVEDCYFDQLKLNGHDNRIEDLELFSQIGLKTLRYPFLWERIAPQGVDQANWNWVDQRLGRLKELEIRPIAGFVHHGSGPKYTHLLDTQFDIKLQEYARAFAQRYPWVEDYTPINEIFTTARFSGLYGLWYPHHTNHRSCLQILIHECRATVLAMREIRKINPNARLIQTDDLGKASSTPQMKYQADFENERRWLGWDLLCGKVTRDHALWDFLMKEEICPKELLWFSENPCPPNIIGVNHYLLSNRYFDEKVERYPSWSHGFNQRHRYSDIEAVRVEEAPQLSPREIFLEAWNRYNLPLAVTEVHVDAPREDQVRWFMKIWNSALDLRNSGVPMEAVTSWGLLGHYDWHCLVTRCEGYYESGVYDLRSPGPRPTLLAKMLKELAVHSKFEHHALNGKGWWERSTRVRYPKQGTLVKQANLQDDDGRILNSTPKKTERPLLITGARGTLGRAFAKICEMRGLTYQILTREQMDIANLESVESAVSRYQPWAVINTAGFVKVDEAEGNQETCFRENVHGPHNLAQVCANHNLSLVTFSSDLVFDGKLTRPYLETDKVNPLSIYGRSKVRAEEMVLGTLSNALVIRTSSFFGPWDNFNFVTQMIDALKKGVSFTAISDLKVSPTYVPELVHVTLNLLLDGEKGIWHLTNQGEISWYEFASEIAKRFKLDQSLIQSRLHSDLEYSAPRPVYSALMSERGKLLQSLDVAITQFSDAFST